MRQDFPPPGFPPCRRYAVVSERVSHNESGTAAFPGVESTKHLGRAKRWLADYLNISTQPKSQDTTLVGRSYGHTLDLKSLTQREIP